MAGRCKKIILWTIKATIAGVLAFLILNVIVRFYYYIPYNVECESGATDYKFPAEFRGFNGTEGFVSIRLDENGYNNESVPENIDVLCMGSSNTLAYCVKPGYGWPALLNKSLEKEGKEAYNIGMFAHSWLTCNNNLENALKEFQPKDYVVVECLQEKWELESLQALVNGEYKELNDVADKKMQIIKKFPYLQLVGHQVKLMRSYKNEISNDAEDTDTNGPSEEYKNLLNQLFEKIYTEVSRYGCNYVLLYNPSVIDVDKKGKAYSDHDERYLSLLKEMCDEYKFIFVDMTPYYLEAYEHDFVLTSGFYNTKMGYGHINRDGHRIIAEVLNERIVGN